MRLPRLQNSEKYVGLYIFDFGEQVGMGFTAEEVTELLESQKYKDCKVYKIHKAYPDGRLELKGVPAQTFQLEAGLFFYSFDLGSAQRDFEELVGLAARSAPPARAKVHLAGYGPEKFAVAIIYPAEYDDEVSSWLLDGGYKTAGPAEGGIEAVQRYYQDEPEILQSRQLFGQSAYTSRSGPELVAATKLAVVR